jgi:uncharacterized DUF497 family protein
VRFTWNRTKSDANLRERGFDFAFASLVFDGPTLVAEDTRRDYGERHFVAIGLADGVHLTVVCTDRVGAGVESPVESSPLVEANAGRERYL